MSAQVEKLKKKAAEFEQKKQFDRALEVYLQIIGASEDQEEPDVTVYNRVGDLYLRLSKADQAVNYYEQAVDLYTDGGYLNNAIALCNKILRHAPARHQIYYKLGKISAKKGFNSDAKKNFLEYADRMHRAGKDTEAFKALQEFADLCPGQDDIRLMLADQLARAGKKGEAIEQLQILHESLDAEGRTAEAEATVQRIHSLDPGVEPRRSSEPRAREAGGLVFLDVGASPVKPRPKIAGVKPASHAPEPPRPATPPHQQPSPEFEQLPDIELTPDDEAFPEIEPLDFEPIADLELDPEPGSQSGNSHVPGLMQTGSSMEDTEPAFDLSLSELEVPPLEGLESAADPDSFAIDPETDPVSASIEGLESSEPGLGEPLNDQDPLSGLSVLEDDRFFVHDTDPLAGLGGQEDEETPVDSSTVFGSGEEEHSATGEAHATLEADTFELEDVEAEEEKERKAAEEEEQRAEDERAEARKAEEDRGRKASKEKARKDAEEKEQKAEEERRKKPSTPRRVARKAPQRTEPDEVEHEEESRAEQERLKQSRLKVVQPVRPTRPKPRPEPEQAKEPEPAEKRPLNPFLRPRAKEAPSQPTPKAAPRVPTPPEEVPRLATPKKVAHQPAGDDKFVDLADWLREDAGPRSYRMVAADDKRIGEEQADFTDMLEKFKAGVAANVDDEDFDSHYDLGVAYREMGLIDEAVAEFQKALRGSTQRLRAYEALGQCFIDRAEYDVAITILSRALREPGLEDEDLIAVLYLLGFASEEGKKPRDAAAYYQRVFAVDIDFRDVSKRLKHMGKVASK
ncbi:MAG: tetratricopeptide repeat protein [Gemmatimonadaceae bacterium]